MILLFEHPIIPARPPVVPEPDMLADRALVPEPAFFQHMGRCHVKIVALPVHPVQGQGLKPEHHERPENS